MAYYLRKSNLSKGIYLQIYESHRVYETKSVRSKHFKTLGYVSYLESIGVKDPVTLYSDAVKKMNDINKSKRLESKKKEASKDRYIGFFPPASIYRKLDVKGDIENLQTDRKYEYSLSQCLEYLIYARLVNPASKLKTVNEVIPTLWGAPHFSYDQVLSCIDLLGSNYSKVVEIFTYHTHETYILDVSTTYFDCTNFYFEIDAEDDLRRKGPSKENRADPIIGMGLLLDSNCIPIGMRLYPGNQSEKPVLRQVLRSLKKQQGITGRTVRVADKGLNCAENIHDAIGANDGYIFSKSVLMLPEKEMDWAVDDKGFIDVKDSDGKCTFRIKSTIDNYPYTYCDGNGRRHSITVKEKRIVTYNPSLAKKKKYELDKLVKKAKYLVLSQAKKSDYGESAKYMIFKTKKKDGEDGDENIKAELNTKLIEKHRKCAGFNMIVTSEYKMDDIKVYNCYHELWRIEESFRTLKSYLEARPVYLQNYNRIQGHFLVCYLSVLLERLFQFKILEGKFGSEKVYDFMHELKVLPTDGFTVLNPSPRSDVSDFLSVKYDLPLDKYYLTRDQIAKILKKPL